MKKILPILIFVCTSLLLTGLAKCAEIIKVNSGYIFTDVVYLKIDLVNQDPYPAEPGGYVDLLFKLENRGTETAENVTVELIPEYPFSLDPGTNATKDLGIVKGWQIDKEAFLFKYKVRVDKDAIDGENEIKLKYTYDSKVNYTKTFNVTISNPRTDFDVIIEDFTQTSTTLTIVNIGSKPAYSVIVKIPNQENFRVAGSSSNIIGNLNPGDYASASFQIIPRNITQRKNLLVEISYTDILGIRRSIEKEVMLFEKEVIPAVITQRARTQQSLISTGLFYIIIGIIGIIVVVVIFKFTIFRKKRR